MRINFVVASESLSSGHAITSKCSKHEIPCTHGKQIQIGSILVNKFTMRNKWISLYSIFYRADVIVYVM